MLHNDVIRETFFACGALVTRWNGMQHMLVKSQDVQTLCTHPIPAPGAAHSAVHLHFQDRQWRFAHLNSDAGQLPSRQVQWALPGNCPLQSKWAGPITAKKQGLASNLMARLP